MKRREFIKKGITAGGCLLFVPVVSALAKDLPDDCISSCQECRRDYECCKIPKWVSEEEFKIMQNHLSDGWVLDAEFKKGFGWTIKTVPCPFLDKDNKCKIYDVRPHTCRTYFCNDFCLTKEEKKEINRKILKEWNFGKNVK